MKSTKKTRNFCNFSSVSPRTAAKSGKSRSWRKSPRVCPDFPRAKGSNRSYKVVYRGPPRPPREPDFPGGAPLGGKTGPSLATSGNPARGGCRGGPRGGVAGAGIITPAGDGNSRPGAGGGPAQTGISPRGTGIPVPDRESPAGGGNSRPQRSGGVTRSELRRGAGSCGSWV